MNKKFKTLSEVYQTGKSQEIIKEEKKPFVPMSSLYQLVKEAEEEDLTHTVSVDGGPDVGITDKEYKSIKHLMHDRGEINKYIKLIMSQSKLEKDKAKEIVKVILNSNSSQPIFDYLTNREETGVTIDELLQARNIFTVDKWSNFDPQFLAWLATFKWVEKGIGMGSGEILVSVLIKGARKAGASGEKGDTIVNDVELEIKSDNGRLKGQRGYNQGPEAAQYWFEQLSGLISSRPELNIQPPAKPGGSEYNFTLSNKGWELYKKGNELIQASANTDTPITLIAINQLAKDGLKRVFADATDQDVMWIDELITQPDFYLDINTIAAIDYRYAIMQIALYMRIEEIDSILTFSMSPFPKKHYGSVGIITPDNLSEFQNYGTRITSRSSFSAGGGAFGMVLGISAGY